MLEIKDLYVNYGAVHALNGVSMTVKDGEIVSLIGANGAGKTNDPAHDNRSGKGGERLHHLRRARPAQDRTPAKSSR